MRKGESSRRGGEGRSGGEEARRWAGSRRGLGAYSKDFGFYTESDVSRARGVFEQRRIESGQVWLPFKDIPCLID